MSSKILGLTTILLSCFLSGKARAQTSSVDEYEIKAEMLTNVFKLVDWPAAKAGGPSAPFIVGVVGSDDMGQALGKAIAKMSTAKVLSGHPVEIRRISGTEGVDQCHAVFVGGSDRKRLQAIVQAAQGLPILTVGENDKFASSGGMVGLVITDDRIQVEVNLAAAQSAGLSISSRLLRIATIRKGGA